MALSKKQKTFILGISMAVGFGALVSAISHFLASDFFNGLEKVSYDYRYLFKYVLGKESTQREQDLIEGMTIVDIDERAMAKLGLYYKWPRSYHGRAVEELSAGGAASIVFDIMFKTADFGRSRAEETQEILVNALPHMDGRETFEALRNGLNYDSVLIKNIRNSHGVIAAAFMNEKNAYPNQSDWKHLATEEWHRSLHPRSAAAFPPEVSRHFRTLPILDNIFPEFAQASTRMGLVNVLPDADGIHRSIPLLYNFPDPKISGSPTANTYPVSALQTSLYLLGMELKDIKVTPGESLNLGPALRVFRKNGRLETSYPGLSPRVIRQLLQKKEGLLNLGSEHPGTVHISNPIIIRKDMDGQFEAEVLEGQFIAPALIDALTRTPLDWARLAAITEEAPYPLSEFAGIYPGEDEDRYRVWDSESEEEVVLDEYTLKEINEAWPSDRLRDLPPGESYFHSLYLNIGYSLRRKAYTSPLLILTGDVIRDLCRTDWTSIQSLQEGDLLGFGKDIVIPIDDRGRMLINYQGLGGPNKTFRYLSYYDVIKKRLDPTTYQGKTFILGSSAAALFDIVASTFDETYPGVEIHATVINNILTKNFMRRLGSTANLLILLVLSIAVGLIAYFLRMLWALLAAGLIGSAYAALAFYAFHYNTWIELVRPEMAIFFTFLSVVMARYVFEEKDKRFLNEAFKNYISPELIDMMVESGNKPSLGGKEGYLTAYFTDIQGFSTFSEKLGSPTKLVELLNEYLSEMTNILLANQGTLDKYEGDAIIAFFGAPVEFPNHQLAACKSALAMQKKLADLRAKWKSEGDKWPEIVHNMRMRIGLNSGPIVTGNMGSRVRMNYTMMGDAVNLAARLESGAKQYGVYTMCSEDTLAGMSDAVLSRELDLIRVVGKLQPVRVYELIDLIENARDSTLECLDLFHKGLIKYREQKWEDAITFFAKSMPLELYRPDQNPGCKTTPSQVMLERCHKYQTDRRIHLPKDWDGVFTAAEK